MGQNAIVFELESDNGRRALKVFTHPPGEDSDRRYPAIESLRQYANISALVECRWIANGMSINGESYPAVDMEMVDGTSLGSWILKNVTDEGRMTRIPQSFLTTSIQLRQSRAAHGDLQCENLLVQEDGSLRLIDYDCFWLPSLVDIGVSERGHVHFQHPQRISEGYWHEYVDAFSCLSIYVSLRALASNSNLVEFCDEDHLLFTNTDYKNPSATEVWNVLASSKDLSVRRLSGTLALMCEREAQIEADLQGIINSSEIVEAAPYFVPAFDRIWVPDDPVYHSVQSTPSTTRGEVTVTSTQKAAISNPSRSVTPKGILAILSLIVLLGLALGALVHLLLT
jgi:serine/threonine protein kinase